MQSMNQNQYGTGEQDLFAPGEEGGICLEDVFTAYFDCRRHKRGSYNALAFEYDYERKCVDLWKAINAGTYRPQRSIVFIVTHPVTREVFAPSFESRVVDHLIASKIEPLFEKQFIDDNYATRKEKGTLYGINRIYQHIRECSANYTQDCYIMKLDIRSFFMSLPKHMVHQKMEKFIIEHYHEKDLPALLFMLRSILLDNPEKHCVRRCPRSKWKDLPPDKSLFNSDGKHGLPIGRLTSQLSAAFTLDPLDHLITEDWGIKHYGRYVDDMVLIDRSEERLLEIKQRIFLWLSERGMELHPKKMYLQHYKKGVNFIGGRIMPGRIYIHNRSLGFAFDKLIMWNKLAENNENFAEEHAEQYIAVLNSYLGLLRQYSAYNQRKKLIRNIGKEWWNVMYIQGHLEKAVLKKAYNSIRMPVNDAAIAAS